MNLEFHYYIIHLLASRAGIPGPEAGLIARSSQYVDDNIVAYDIETERGTYATIVTQNYGWWDESFIHEAYLPFHFFPGGACGPCARRRDGGANPLSCAPNSAGVKALLIRALKTRDPYRVGIGLHTFADSWAHQDFSGALEAWNRLGEDSPLPPIGHAQALTAPDDLAAEWTDPRLLPPRDRIRNRERFLRAATLIYRYLCAYNRRPFDDAGSVVADLFDRHVAPDRVRDPEERALDLIISAGIPKYDRREWLREAVATETDPFGEELSSGYDRLLWLKDALLARAASLHRNRLRARPGFFGSSLHRWYEAARAHLLEARRIMGAAEPARR